MQSTRRAIPISKNWQPFFNTSVLAAYHFELQIVSLDDIDQPILTALKGQAPAARNKVFPLVAHEYTHWIDHVGSLWGRRLLYSFFRGLVARQQNNMDDFPWMVEARRNILRSSSVSYFHSFGPMKAAQPPWAWALSIGCRFDRSGQMNESDPIPFIRFGVGDTTDENLIARMPISAASLSEVRAMAAELAWVTGEEKKLGEGNTPASRLRWVQEYSQTVYNDDMLVYVSAVHLLSNHCGSTEITEVLPAASALAWIALNFPSSLIDSLKIPATWSAKWQRPGSGLDRITPLLKACDPGFIYTLLCFYAPSPSGLSVELWLDAVLLTAARESLESFESAWLSELDRSSREQGRELLDPLFQGWMKTGDEWARALGVTGISPTFFDAVEGGTNPPFPDAMTGDLQQWSPSRKPADLGDGRSFLERYNFLDRMRDEIDEFLNVCGL